ncbi:succinate dehydrogenase assembly factor 2 [Haematospirillum sp. 15-248]|uniref:FAD assembly factor SdhE n=1 Tax=Haematospirillum sp. 15-248 TaxID=2723107 RepID=UPI00143A1F80|nr:succinate dehydrogenase assembly factor 2 [Haematospirillum sp. 15-248]NKD86959.1 succinate dehydrogenase assembly factor 2 [Haematospirillum sp. 15-248]
MDERRRKILYRASHRGMKEADLMIGGFVAARISELDAPQLDRLESLLDELDMDIMDWVIGRKPVPSQHDHDVFHMLTAFKLYDGFV